MSDDFNSFMRNERERLTEERNRLRSNRQNIDAQLADLDREFAALDAYEAAKTGKRPSPAKINPLPRVRRGSRRQDILDAVRESPSGMARGELLEHLGLKGDKSGEMSVSNALTAMAKAGQLVREGGRYFLPEPEYPKQPRTIEADEEEHGYRSAAE